MIESLISALGLKLGLTSKEIADVVWLALQMNEVDRPPNLVPDRPEKARLTPQPQPTAEPSFPPSEQRERSDKPSEPQAELYAPDYQDSASMAGALALKVPDARSMREPLSLARALKPLLRKVMTGYRMVLDETATVERIAEEGVWLPVLQPSLEPWLELALVVDESVSMQIWRRTIVELQRFMEHYGVFRDVRVWGLLTDEQGQVQIRPGIGKAAMRQGLRRPSELIDPSGRRLILVVTDCVSPLWRDGTIQPALKLWAASGPMAIVQMLPEWLWARTGLGLASTVRFQSMAAGLANQQLRVRDLSPWDDVDMETGVKVPVVTLEPERFGAWAEMMTGKCGTWATGVIFESGAIGVSLPLRSDEALDGEQRVQQFRVTASPMARQLAGLLAAAPAISLPIVRIIQERLLKESRQVHVAEVFLGGLLKPLVEITLETNVDSVQYEFLDGVRDVLLESMRTSETINVLNEVSQFVAERLGLSIDAFMAVLRSPQQLENQEFVGTARPFAIVTAKILKQLGGKYTELAEVLERGSIQENNPEEPNTLNAKVSQTSSRLNLLKIPNDIKNHSIANVQQIIQNSYYSLFGSPSVKPGVDWELAMLLLSRNILPDIRVRLKDSLCIADIEAVEVQAKRQEDSPILALEPVKTLTSNRTTAAEPIDPLMPIIQAYARDDIKGKLLILGSPGAGKTITLLKLAEQLVGEAIEHPKTVIPIIFELSTWRNRQNIEDWLIEQLYKNFSANRKRDRKARIYETWLERQVLLPLMDGLDELGMVRQKSCTVKLNEFAKRYPYLVVCCRVKEFQQAGVNLSNLRGKVQLQPLTG